MALEDKKQLLIIGGAVVAGIAAVLLASNYIKSSIQGQTAALAERYDSKQKEMISELQEMSEQKMAAIAQEIERMKSEQSGDMQKQLAALQEAQREQAKMQQPGTFKRNIKSSLALKTPVGKRAVTVMIDSLAAVGGLINAGDFVDVIAQLNVPNSDSDKKTVTAMIFQGLEVLAVNTNLDTPGSYEEQQASAALKITFAVDPQEAGLLTFADKNGTLELALRSPGENARQIVKASTWKTLADYVLKNQGLDIQNPDGENLMKTDENKPGIQIFRGGKEL